MKALGRSLHTRPVVKGRLILSLNSPHHPCSSMSSFSGRFLSFGSTFSKPASPRFRVSVLDSSFLFPSTTLHHRYYSSPAADVEPEVAEQEEEDPLEAYNGDIETLDLEELAALSAQQPFFADGSPSSISLQADSDTASKKKVGLFYRSYIGIDARDYADLMTSKEIEQALRQRLRWMTCLRRQKRRGRRDTNERRRCRKLIKLRRAEWKNLKEVQYYKHVKPGDVAFQG